MFFLFKSMFVTNKHHVYKLEKATIYSDSQPVMVSFRFAVGNTHIGFSWHT
jgi:hypothetical protein